MIRVRKEQSMLDLKTIEIINIQKKVLIMATIYDKIDLSEVAIDGDWLEYLCDPTVALDPSRRGFDGTIVKPEYFNELLEPEVTLEEEKEIQINVSNNPLPSMNEISNQDLLNRIGLKEDPNSKIQGPITREMLLKRIGMTEKELGYERREKLK